MISFNGSLVLPDDTPMTILEMVQAAIAARTYTTQAQEDAAVSRFAGARITEGFFSPATDVYMIDAYKGVGPNGKAVAASWAGADFTAAPGGGEVIGADESKHFNNGVDLNSRVCYQNSGGDVVIYVDFAFG